MRTQPQAIDEFTVQFTLTQPYAPFIGTLPQLFVVNPAIVEANLGDDMGQSYLKENAAGSGPFTQGPLGDWQFVRVHRCRRLLGRLDQRRPP